MIDEMKTCTGCKVTKPTEDFYKKKSGRFGVEAWCRKCRIADRMRRFEENRDREKAYQRVYSQKNKEMIAEKRRAYNAANRGKEVSRTLRYRARKRDATVGDLPVDILAALKLCYGETCMHPECNRVDVEVDHVVPLFKGGANSMDNFQLLCRSHNASKGVKTIDYRRSAPG